MVLIDKLAGRLCDLEAGIYQALHEENHEFMGVLLATHTVPRPNRFEFVHYQLRVSSLVSLDALQIDCVDA